jgi:hypothetical protein
LFTPLGQVWGLYVKEEASASPKDAALRLALETFESMSHKDSIFAGEFDNEITAIKAALETKEESWEKFCDSHCVWTDHHPDCKLAKDEPVSQPKVRTGNCLRVGVCASEGHKIQPQRTWVGLTVEEKQEWIDAMPSPPQPRHFMVLLNAIESDLKERNT